VQDLGENTYKHFSENTSKLMNKSCMESYIVGLYKIVVPIGNAR
jgi:hypothetical protein